MLNENIKKLRVSLNISQVTLAKMLGVSKQSVSNWENDNIQPSIEMLVRIAKLFHVSTDYLLGLSNAPTLNVEGLPSSFVAHITQIIQDYKQK